MEVQVEASRLYSFDGVRVSFFLIFLLRKILLRFLRVKIFVEFRTKFIFVKIVLQLAFIVDGFVAN